MQVAIVKNEGGGNSISTVVLRGSTDSILDDLERAVDDGVNTYKVISNVACFHNKLILGISPYQSCKILASANPRILHHVGIWNRG